MRDDSVKLLQLEKEFREAVMSELSRIKINQDDLSDEVCGRIYEIKKEIVRIHNLDENQNRMLDEHIKRSKYLEDLVIHLRDSEIKPLTKHVHMVHGGLKLLGIISLLVGIATGVVKILTSI